MEEDNIVTLKDEMGRDVSFEFLDLVEYQGSEYVILLPVDDSDDDSGEVVILKLESSDDNSDEETYVSVEDEETLSAIFELFKEKYKNEFDFEN